MNKDGFVFYRVIVLFSQKLLKSFMCVNNSRDTVTLNTIHVPNIQNLERSGISQLKLNVALLSVSERRQFLPQPV